ncbi:MAG: ABC transporter substrate-binding protein [Candidatus Korobacteraceae bacterium]
MKRRALLSIILAVAAGPCFASRTLQDELGRTVVVPDHPHRLICLTPSVADALYALGAESDVVGVSEYTKYPPQARQKPSIGLPLNPSLETIVLLHPDLVVGSADLAPQNLKGFERLGIPVFLVKPIGIGGIYSSLLDMGKALNREAAAKELVFRLSSRVEAVRARVQGKQRVRVFMLIWADPILTVGKAAFITDLIAAAGGESITGNLAHEYPRISFETVVALAPESILLIRASKMSVENLAQRAGWDSLPAIRNRSVYYVDDRLNLPSPVAIDALEDLARQFHP